MKDIKEVYPGEEERYWFGDYQPMLESFGYPILLQIDDTDYSGDSRLILQDGEKYGILIFGWGSCSGCDALQACNSYEDVDRLRSELFENIKWFDSATATLEYITTHDWEGDYSWYEHETREFVEQAKKLMEERRKAMLELEVGRTYVMRSGRTVRITAEAYGISLGDFMGYDGVTEDGKVLRFKPNGLYLHPMNAGTGSFHEDIVSEREQC